MAGSKGGTQFWPGITPVSSSDEPDNDSDGVKNDINDLEEIQYWVVKSAM